MAGRQTPSHVSDGMIPFRKPDPVTVAIIMRDYSYDAAIERWSSWSPKTLSMLASQGRGTLAKRTA